MPTFRSALIVLDPTDEIDARFVFEIQHSQRFYFSGVLWDVKSARVAKRKLTVNVTPAAEPDQRAARIAHGRARPY